MPERLGERLLVENDRVRVWRDASRPAASGRCTPTGGPYLSVVLRGAHGETVDGAGTVLTTVHRSPGDVRFFGPDAVPTTHRLRNTGAEEIEVVIVELL